MDGDNKRMSPLVDRVGDTGFLQMEAESFNLLSSRQKGMAYWLSMAAIAVNPIAYDQNSFYGLDLKHLIEQILTHPRGINPVTLKKLTDYTKLFWANRGNHNLYTSAKFVPDFTPKELLVAALQALRNGAAVGSKSKLLKQLRELRMPIFDKGFQHLLTVKNPTNGEDPLKASGNNFYDGVTTDDLKQFRDKYPLNSRLAKKNGNLIEQVYRSGGGRGRAPAGLYAEELGRAIRYVGRAAQFADGRTKKVLEALVQYFKSGESSDWNRFNIDWVRVNGMVDFSIGFIEVYKDPRGLKGSIQGCVTVVDKKMKKLMKNLAANARHFERRAPWPEKYKRVAPHLPIVNAVDVLIGTGDFDVNTIGSNLPNETEIQEKYGSKSFIYSGSIRMLNAASGTKISDEFAYSQEERARAEKYQTVAEELGVAMHEVLGHGSGRVNSRLTEDPAVYLKECYSTIEEARADLVALWNFFDPKLQEIGAMPDIEIAKAAYDAQARSALVQLSEFPKGNRIEQDHRRGTQLIVNFIRKKGGAIQDVKRGGKVYLVVRDYDRMRKVVGILLAKLMRIVAEGDYNAARALISKYGIHFNLTWRDQVVKRYESLGLPTFWSGINPHIVRRKRGGTWDYTVVYPRDVVKQQLWYSAVAGK